jgi:tRNA threonylcarbamoyladenosine biosynthesis protein TsaB
MTPLVLSIETATRAGSIAVARGQRVLAAHEGSADVSHSINLLWDIENVLQRAELALKDIELFAAASGPGSFTGLRIGLATVKAFAATLKRACAGVPTLHAIAYGAGASPATVALLPAGRGEVYLQIFSVSEEKIVRPLNRPQHIAPAKIFAEIESFPYLKWAGVERAPALLEEIERLKERQAELIFEDDEGDARLQMPGHRRRWVIAPPAAASLAESIALLAVTQYRDETVSAEALRATYVRPSDAELNERCLPQSPHAR